MRPVRLAAIAVAVAAWLPAPAAQAFGIEGLSVAATEAGGAPASLAGSHPFALRTEIGFQPGTGDARDLFLALPPGLIENPGAVPACTQADFHTPRSSPYETPSRSGESCPEATQIGLVRIDTGAAPGGSRYFGVFNLAPPPGSPSQFGFAPFGAPIVFTPHVREAGGEYGLTLASHNLTQLFDLQGMGLTIWGSPWDLGHDGQRGDCLNEAEPASPHAQCPVPANQRTHSPQAYLTLPAACSSPLAFAASADSWQQPGGYLPSGDPDLSQAGWQSAGSQLPASLEGCGQLDFSAQAFARPTSEFVSSPTGLGFELETSQAGLLGPNGRLSSQIEKATIVLPEGMTINPSVGAGLGACTLAQYAAETSSSAPGAGCPNPSKVGTVTLETPLVNGLLAGSLFIATPFQNPFGSPYALYFVAKSPERGFIVKVAGRLDADPGSGHLIATFDDLPQLPYSDLEVDFRAGQRAPLVTPAACGTYTSQILLNPWVDPTASLRRNSSFKLTKGLAAGGACPSGGAPFAPHAVAGTLNANAGSATSFYLHLTRSDAEQEITSYSAQLPPGLLGKIAGIPFCPDAAIESAKGRSGFEEAASPSCPAASEIGHTYSGYGAGLAPAYSAGRFYLAGPYHGQPLSVVAINPAIVGPFDLGTIVIRSAIDVDPHSARVTIDSTASDPIPHIFAGIPLRLRDVRVHVDRPGFMLNPTSCAPFQVASTLTGSDAPFANPRSATAQASAPFQVSNCSSLRFAPEVALRLSGPSRRGAYPALKVAVTPRPGDAGIAAAAVTLPPSQFLAQSHIRGVCTKGQSAAEACPASSIVGHARAETPLLSSPLEGPVYLRSSANPLPDLVIVLNGSPGIHIALEGRIDSSHRGIRGTFEGLPDAPVSKFTMTIFGGRKRGILVNAENLCRRPQQAIARLVGQSNLGEALKPRVDVKCAKKRKRGKRKRGRGGSR
jgi:hypothetical protein